MIVKINEVKQVDSDICSVINAAVLLKKKAIDKKIGELITETMFRKIVLERLTD